MKKIALTLKLKDARIINDDDIDDIKLKMLTDMYEYITSIMSFETFCNMCIKEISEVEE